MRNEVLHRVKEERTILHMIKTRKTNWIGRIWRRNCPLKQVIEGKIEGRTEVRGRRERRRKQLLEDFTETRECWTLKEEALDGSLSGKSFGRGSGPDVRQTRE